METVLIVDDEKNYTLVLQHVLEDAGFETLTANSGVEALEILENSDVDVVLTDMKMPGMSGMELLEKIKSKTPDLPVLMMTAYGTVEKAVTAIQKGAYNYIVKPFDNDSLVAHITKVLEMYRIVKDRKRLLDEAESTYKFGNIIGRSKAMQNVFTTIRKVAPTNASVLIEGESGTGKDMVAKSIHFNSPRKNESFIPVNCSALAESLLESELFGHEKGAFTGAVAKKKGRFELADRGTIFLDEIGELSPALQVKLLRVLQERAFERVGAEKTIKVDIRVIAATNKVLGQEVNAGRFRSDLFYRLNVVHLQLPSLKERREDIGLLANRFIRKHCKEMNKECEVAGIDKRVEQLFHNYGWPGNIRELENVIESALILCEGKLITDSCLPDFFKENMTNMLNIKDIPADAGLYETLAMVEKRMIKRALALSGNVQAHAAKMLKIGKSGLNQKIKKFNLTV